MKTLITIILILVSSTFLVLVSCDTVITDRSEMVDELKTLITIQSERAYFEGQKDALEGDIRIKRDYDSNCWRWDKTPWNDGTPTTFDPSSVPLVPDPTNTE